MSPIRILAVLLPLPPAALPAADLRFSPEHQAAVNRTGPFPASKPVKVEKVELHLQ